MVTGWPPASGRLLAGPRLSRLRGASKVLEWFDRDQLAGLALGPFATTLMTELGYL